MRRRFTHFVRDTPDEISTWDLVRAQRSQVLRILLAIDQRNAVVPAERCQAGQCDPAGLGRGAPA